MTDMAMNAFQDALNDSLDRLANGETIQDCIDLYPEYARQLEIALSMGQALRRGQADVREVQQVRRTVWSKIEGEIDDWNNGARGSSNARPILWLFLTSFLVGIVALMIAATLGSRLQHEYRLSAATPTGTMTSTSSATPRIIPTVVIASPTNRPSVTPFPTLSVTSSPTAPYSPTVTPVLPATTTAPALPSATATRGISATPTACVPQQPDGWTTYRIQPGDTLSGIAVASGASVTDLSIVNCTGAFIIAGEVLFVPNPIIRVTVAVPQPDDQDTDAAQDERAGDIPSTDSRGDDNTNNISPPEPANNAPHDDADDDDADDDDDDDDDD